MGELSGLADQLEDLLLDSPSGLTSFPRVVATSLLVDRVFHQAPKVSKRVAAVAVDELTLRYAFERWYFDRGALAMDLSGAGQQAAAERALRVSMKSPIAALRREAAYSLGHQVSETLRAETWLAARPDSRDERAVLRWLEAGLYARTLLQLDTSTAAELMKQGNEYWELLAQGGHHLVLEDTEATVELLRRALDGKLDVDRLGGVGRHVGVLLHPLRYELLLRRDNFHFAEMLVPSGSLESPLGELHEKVSSLLQAAGTEFSSSRGPWDSLFEMFEESCGRSWMVWRLAGSAAGADLLDSENKWEPAAQFACSSALNLAVTAKGKRSDVKWWKELAAQADDELRRRVWLLFLTKFANPVVLRECLVIADGFCEGLSSLEFAVLYEVLERQTGSTIPESRSTAMLAESKTHRLRVLLASRSSKSVRSKVSQHMPDEAMKLDSTIANACLAWTLAAIPTSQDDAAWRTYLREVVRLFAFCDEPFIGLFESREAAGMPTDHASEVLKSCDSFPTAVVSMADRSASAALHSRLTPVTRTARKEKWAAR